MLLGNEMLEQRKVGRDSQGPSTFLFTLLMLQNILLLIKRLVYGYFLNIRQSSVLLHFNQQSRRGNSVLVVALLY